MLSPTRLAASALLAVLAACTSTEADAPPVLGPPAAAGDGSAAGRGDERAATDNAGTAGGTAAPASSTSPGAAAWTVGEPAPQVAGFRRAGENEAGLPLYEKDLPGGVTMSFVLVPAGTFTMGSPPDEPGRLAAEGPQVELSLSAFLLARTECTQEQWQAVMGGNPSLFPQAGPQAPVENVSFHDVQQFCSRAGLALPSEAQWEYAARAGSREATYAGPVTVLGAAHVPELDAIAWYPGNSGVDYDGADSSGWPSPQYDQQRAGTHPVARKAPNAFGLYDMLGNVWEWCQDGWYPNLSAMPRDGSPRAEGSSLRRVHRGGGWDLDGNVPRAALRSASTAKYRAGHLGFRAAFVLEQQVR